MKRTQRKEKAGGKMLPAPEQHGEMGLQKESRGWGQRARFRPYGQGRAASCQATNKRLKENNQIQWRTINKIPLV